MPSIEGGGVEKIYFYYQIIYPKKLNIAIITARQSFKKSI